MRDPNMAAKNPALPDDEVDEFRAVEMSAHITTRHTPTMSEMRRMRGALVKKGAISLSIPRLAGRYDENIIRKFPRLSIMRAAGLPAESGSMTLLVASPVGAAR